MENMQTWQITYNVAQKNDIQKMLNMLGNLEAIPKSRKALWLGRPTFTVNVENLRDTSTAWHVPKQ